jgi:hypothetical protein
VRHRARVHALQREPDYAHEADLTPMTAPGFHSASTVPRRLPCEQQARPDLMAALCSDAAAHLRLRLRYAAELIVIESSAWMCTLRPGLCVPWFAGLILDRFAARIQHQISTNHSIRLLFRPEPAIWRNISVEEFDSSL